jgi:HPt (histidine-containing phosphotransfer) domain-containing protein
MAKGKAGAITAVIENRRIRQEALREELKAREYLRQIEEIDKRLSKNARTLESGELQALKLRVEIQFRRLAKVLPDVKAPPDEPVRIEGFDAGKSLSETGARIVAAMAAGTLTPSEASSMLAALSSQTRIIETDELEQRIRALEQAHQLAGRSR